MSDNTVWPKKSYAWFVTIILLITYTVSFIDRAIINFLYDPIKKDLGLSETEMGYIGGYAFAFSYILLSLPVGRIVDKFNRIFVLIFGVVLWSFATAAHGFSRDYYLEESSRKIAEMIILCLFQGLVLVQARHL